MVVPLAILAAGVLGFVTFVATRPHVDRGEPEPVAPLVRTVDVEPRTMRFRVLAHGTVQPLVESELRAEIDGEIAWVSPKLAPGSFFEAGEPLVRIDPTDYENELEAARASRDRAKSALSRARREHERQQSLLSESAASLARADEARDEFRAADAALREAEVRIARAERDLDRTEIRAPYAGRTRDKHFDIGQFVRRGDELAELYGVEYAEVPLPVPDRELAFIDLLHPYRDTQRDEQREGPRVRLRADFAGARNEWTGHLVRTAAEIDPKSRTVSLVARVEDPYGRTSAEPGIPLPVGLFVEAEIEGRLLEDAVVLPTTALRDDGIVYVIDPDGRLHFREVEVLRHRRDEVVIGEGLQAGERVAITPLRGAVDGMQVRVIGIASREENEPGADERAALAERES
jgi:RND family efflux transporter MFP subunit